jgi:hypothetical protein
MPGSPVAYPTAAPLPGMPVVPGTANRGFMMAAGPQQPAPGKAAPPTDSTPTTKATEGSQRWPNGNNIFR